jgi:hypothetical protein
MSTSPGVVADETDLVRMLGTDRLKPTTARKSPQIFTIQAASRSLATETRPRNRTNR